MKNRSLIIIGILLCLLIAAGAYFWAMGMIDSNYDYRSPLKDTPPAPGEALGEPATNRLVFVLIDALRYDTSLKPDVMPTLGHLREIGASALMHSRPPSFSEPGYTTLLTGAWPEINDGPVFNLDYEEIPVFTQDNVFSAAKRQGFSTGVSGYYWFEKLIPQKDVDFSFYTPGEDNAADREVVDAALPWLNEGKTQLTLIHIDQVDYAGHHEGGPVSPNWDAAAARSDAMLAEILATLDLEKDTILVLSDHGQIDAGGHGGQDPIVLMEPFVLAGKAIRPGNYADMNMVDVAPTIAAILGLNLPASAQGEVLTSMLELPVGVQTKIPISTREQQSNLLRVYAGAISPKADYQAPLSEKAADYQAVMNDLRSQRVFTDRIWRSAVAAVYLAIAITLLIRNRKRDSLSWVAAGVLFALLFNLRYAVLDGKVYSLSSITGQTEMILYVGITSAAAMVIAWLVICGIRKVFSQSPAQATKYTISLGLTTVFVLSLPVIVSFVLNGAVVNWTLPDYTTSFVALLGLIQLLVASVFTPLLGGVSALISFLSNRKSVK